MRVRQQEFGNRPKTVIVQTELTQQQIDDLIKMCGEKNVKYNPNGKGLIYPKRLNNLVVHKLNNWKIEWKNA